MTLDLDKLAAAKLWLISEPTGHGGRHEPRDLPYLAHALYALVPVASSDVVRMTCDEHWRVYVDPDWLLTADVPEVGAELANLVWHLLQDHAERARDQHVDASTAQPWTDAADVTVAHTIGRDGPCPEELRDATDLELPKGQGF